MGFDSYLEACEAEITRAEAEAEIAKHDVPGGFNLFLSEVGDKPIYTGDEVLSWLGY